MTNKTIKNLNCNGAYCYGIKLVVKLIDHYGYDYDEWQEVLNFLCDFTALENHYNEIYIAWCKKLQCYSPTGILAPVYILNYNGFENFYPCHHCKKTGWLFNEYGDDSSFCMNFKNCEYVKYHYRYTQLAYDSPDYKPITEGKYRKYYDLYMKTDITLLRIIEETLQICYGDLATDYFNNDHMPILYDMINTFKALGLPLPDCDDIPDEGFGEENERKRFSSLDLIK